MTDYPVIETLTSSDRELLVKDIGKFQLAIYYGKYIFPVLLILAFLSWYFDWVDIVKFLSTLFGGAALFSVIISYWQIRNIRRDLAENNKQTIRYELIEKYAEGYVSSSVSMKHNDKVKRRIKVYDTEILAAISYRQANQENTNRFLKESVDAYDELLKYTYYFKLKKRDGKTEKIIVPIDYYLVGASGDTIGLTTAVHSRKIVMITAPK